MKTFIEWSAPLLGPDGKWGVHYGSLTPEQKAFIKRSAEGYNSGKFKDILDYKDFLDHKFKYKLHHLFDKTVYNHESED